jgi:hypothetical protein
MNINQLVAKFAQAYVKRASKSAADIYIPTGASLTRLTPTQLMKAVENSVGGASYLNQVREDMSTAGTATTPILYQTGPTGTMSENEKILAYPFAAYQNYGSGAFYNPLNAGFYGGPLNPFTGQNGFGTGGAVASGALGYTGTKAMLNRLLLNPNSYRNNVINYGTPSNMKLQPFTDLMTKSLGVGRQTPQQNIGLNNHPLTAVQRNNPELATGTNPQELWNNMGRRGVPYTSKVNLSDTPRILPQIPGLYNSPVTITATHPNSPALAKLTGKQTLATQLTLNPNTPLVNAAGWPTLAGFARSTLPSTQLLGRYAGVPTGPRGSLRGYAPLAMAGVTGLGIPLLNNTYHAFTAPEDSNQLPFYGFAPGRSYLDAISGAERGLLWNTPTVYRDVMGTDVPWPNN